MRRSTVCLYASLQVQIVSSYPARPTIHARTAQCAWRSWIGTISLWASAVTVAGASPAPAVKSMWMSAAPAPVFTAFATTVLKENKKNDKRKKIHPYNMALGVVARLHQSRRSGTGSHLLIISQLQVIRVLLQWGYSAWCEDLWHHLLELD